MDDAQLWELERQGHPVSHCRARIEARRLDMIAKRTREASRSIERRRNGRATLGLRFA